jgi:hypothetical protein
MEGSTRNSHWGEWIIARSRFVGFRRQLDLATAVGCSENQLCRWKAMATPPATVHCGFDTTLAAALKVDRKTLFTDYANYSPETAPLSNQDNEADEIPIRAEIAAAAERLAGAELRALGATARALLSATAA